MWVDSMAARMVGSKVESLVDWLAEKMGLKKDEKMVAYSG
jgi:hypothetical protein